MKRIAIENSLDYLDYRIGSGGTVEIFDIKVRSKRGIGKGRYLLEMLKAQVSTHLIYAITGDSNGIAKEFYLHCGFREIAKLPQFYGTEDAVMYGIDL